MKLEELLFLSKQLFTCGKVRTDRSYSDVENEKQYLLPGLVWNTLDDEILLFRL